MLVFIPMSMHLLKAKIYHHRLLPKKHHLNHNIFYYMMPLDKVNELNRLCLTRYNQFHIWSISSGDYGFDGDGLNIKRFETIKHDYHIPDGHIDFITVPKFLGHQFNPVSFFLFYDTNANLKAVLAEVHNTFGERHCYLCRHDDGRTITADDILRAEKIFHVSPFFPVSGYYLFQFMNDKKSFNVKIDYYNEQNQKTLVTGIKATKINLTKSKPIWLAIRYPFISVQVLFLIHYHAVILWLKKIMFYKKPKPPSQQISS